MMGYQEDFSDTAGRETEMEEALGAGTGKIKAEQVGGGMADCGRTLVTRIKNWSYRYHKPAIAGSPLSARFTSQENSANAQQVPVRLGPFEQDLDPKHKIETPPPAFQE